MIDNEQKSLLALEQAVRNYVKVKRHDLWPSGSNCDCFCSLCESLKLIDKVRNI